MTPTQARNAVKDIAKIFAGVEGVKQPTNNTLLEAIVILRKLGAPKHVADAAKESLSRDITVINPKLVSDLEALSKIVTQIKLSQREARRLTASISTITGVDLLPKRL